MTTATKEPTKRPFADVYERLRELGLTRPFVRDAVLPSWWDDEAAATPAGRLEGLLILARHLGLELAALRDGTKTLQPAVNGNVRFKKREGAGEDELWLAERLAHQVGQHAALGIRRGKPLPRTAKAVRDAILDDERANWVSLGSLLSFCWAYGVGVIHVSRFPAGAKKMEGMAMRAGEIPIIVVTSERKATGWILFDVAHELGHLCLGHVGVNASVVDEVVDQESVDREEMEANSFAIELLTGSAKTRVSAPDRWPNAEELARQATVLGKQKQTDPTHIVLNYAHSMSGSGGQFWGVANAALKVLEPRADAPGLVREFLATCLDWSALPGDASEFVARLTNAAPNHG